MSHEYEIVKADSSAEAIEKASLKVGDRVVVESVRALANSGGTYSVFYNYAKEQE